MNNYLHTQSKEINYQAVQHLIMNGIVCINIMSAYPSQMMINNRILVGLVCTLCNQLGEMEWYKKIKNATLGDLRFIITKITSSGTEKSRVWHWYKSSN